LIINPTAAEEQICNSVRLSTSVTGKKEKKMLFTETIARALEDWVDISYKPNLKDNSGKECVLVNII